MTKPEWARTEALLGTEAVERLENASVAVFGIGGVGGSAAEALARAGIGKIDLFDGDTVSLSNLNRQIVALRSTLGRAKAEVMRERILDINPDCRVTAHTVFFSAENADTVDFSAYTYVVDAIDDIPAKAELAVRCRNAGTALIMAMGAGNKLDPTGFRVADLSKTEGCPLARAMRKVLREKGILHQKVVFSPECSHTGERTPASVSFVPTAAGLVIAGEVIREISGVQASVSGSFLPPSR